MPALWRSKESADAAEALRWRGGDMIPPIIQSCRTCRHHQASLDPEGCFAQQRATGIIGKAVVVLCGCEGYEYMEGNEG